jgi:hypothetical protein
MSFLTLAEGKAHLRVTENHEDADIQSRIDAACAYCEQYCNRSFIANVPATVKEAAKIMLGEMYTNREEYSMGSFMHNKTVHNLLFSSIDFDGQSSLGLPFDAEGMVSGDTFYREWRWLNSDGSAINITGYTATFELQGKTYALNLLDAVGGRFDLKLGPTVTSEFSLGRSEYRVRATSLTGDVTTIDRRMIEIR